MKTTSPTTEPRIRLIPIEHADIADSLPKVDTSLDVIQQVVEATLDLYQRKGYETPWIGYLALEHDRCVGTCGFAGPPTNDDEIEIAYFTFPGNEGKGIATRMARSLIELTRAEATSKCYKYIAHTLPAEGSSTSILRKLGFALQAEIEHPEDGRIWKWVETSCSNAST